MKTGFRVVALALVLGMAACGGAATNGEPVRTPSSKGYAQQPGFGSYDATGVPAPVAPPSAPAGGYPGGGPSAASVEATPAPAAPPSARDEVTERSPSERPGLGTEWGETRHSEVHDVNFDRASSEPFGVATVRYDDRRGVSALVARHLGERGFSDRVPAGRGALFVSIQDGDGSPLTGHRIGDRTYVIGRAGDRYAIVVSNTSDHRVEAVATVDGLDVMNGQPGSTTNRGYLLEPHATLVIDGFRQSQSSVAAFRFGTVGESYAAQTGSARDVGVIGVAFFAERGDDALEEEARLRDTATPFPGDGRFARPPWAR